MVQKKRIDSKIPPEVRAVKRRWLLLLLAVVIGAFGYVGTTMLDSLKAPDHSHSAEADPDQVRKANTEEIDRLKALLASQPGDAAAMVQLGSLHLKQEEYAAAIDVFSKARNLDGRNVRALTGLGNALRLSGKTDEGLSLLRTSIEIDSTYAESWLLLGVVYRFEKNEPQYARWAWENFLKLEPTGESAERVRKELGSIRAD